ncbi:hypothetical protein DPMN_036772 [Dreissena polymorpha]|uniref:Uncharacterized protein n=1 Tax=Dreissena polymorpha TaxID=45954 RepID=A0A9D4MC58_DREPO|nr:hypothetical protein DPMN_036772 [Dreissena polymorpha]
MTQSLALLTCEKSDATNMNIKEKTKLGTISKDLQDIAQPDFEKHKDKTVKLESKKVSILKAVCFTEVITTDLHNIILLDQNGKILLKANFNGQVTSYKHFSGSIRIVGMQGGCFAVFNGKEIKIYDALSCDFTPSKKKIAGLKNEIEHLTGFDYCCRTEQFAVSGLDKNDKMKLIVVKDSDKKRC